MERSAAERVVKRDLDATTGLGKPVSSRARMAQRSVEAYLKAGVRPRWMERIAEIDHSIAAQRRRLARAHRLLREECDGDAVVACAWLRGDGSASVALPDGEWRDVLDGRALREPLTVAELCGDDGVALLDLQ